MTVTSCCLTSPERQHFFFSFTHFDPAKSKLMPKIHPAPRSSVNLSVLLFVIDGVFSWQPLPGRQKWKGKKKEMKEIKKRRRKLPDENMTWYLKTLTFTGFTAAKPCKSCRKEPRGSCRSQWKHSVNYVLPVCCTSLNRRSRRATSLHQNAPTWCNMECFLSTALKLVILK